MKLINGSDGNDDDDDDDGGVGGGDGGDGRRSLNKLPCDSNLKRYVPTLPTSQYYCTVSNMTLNKLICYKL